MPLELVTTSGYFRLDGGEWEVTNNIWLVGDDREVIVFDAGHDHRPIVEAIAGRKVKAIACTHGHNDHIDVARELQNAVDAPILLHPEDRMLWDMVYPDASPDGELVGGGARCVGVDGSGRRTTGRVLGVGGTAWEQERGGEAEGHDGERGR